ncbi:Modifier of rudimentary (Mod(r)) protein [Geosmithia morbida]|uniref:Modifier of rudimentary (Mod(R)) protein n=1 Tax=Geosmithia morbida TaxID=1094350 RepID=A0A9P4YSZ6_9HYPO|nr:Modifier of rudimentary (Mod(r)) protein [Geosmithia morbida]XP_035321208.1 Modifier of rudimentary (Mod(r)) protein [Geosmithia morbida]KAF4119249.1 Modifier of rudimentary (Mod(r)) protein [Geosmithia morbida]KAF4122556.1 Modifier of rudimentary (Mod(r)) protein [Geosmithia morbida]
MATFTPELHGISASTPPAPPPKPGSHESSGINTPTRTKPSVGPEAGGVGVGGAPHMSRTSSSIPDPGDEWLPEFIKDKSKQDIAAMLADAKVLQALTHSSRTAHPSLLESQSLLRSALEDNIDLAAHTAGMESRLAAQRAATQAQLLSTHALERQWRQRQSDMDDALAPLGPASLYQRLAQGVQEQEAVCQAMEESFLDVGADDAASTATERETADWVRRYREARVVYYLRQERKERWDEGRVGGWR